MENLAHLEDPMMNTEMAPNVEMATKVDMIQPNLPNNFSTKDYKRASKENA